MYGMWPYEPKLMFSYGFRAYMPLDLGFEYILHILKTWKECKSLVRFDLS